MSTLREAAQAVLGQWDRQVLWGGDDQFFESLRAALAQPETEAQPVAWQSRYIGRGEPFGEWRTIEWSLEECANLTRGAVEHMRAQTDFEVRPLYAHPPRDEWRPEDGRRYRYLKSFCSPMGLDADNNHPWTCRINPSRMRGASVDEALDAAMERDGWRDVTSPMEAPIAAKCQRIEGSGEICGLTPPCPDCGSSLIDVPEGSL
jgi:hypothetical protein